jgi:tetratricopeptide (TPR) repeat protein
MRLRGAGRWRASAGMLLVLLCSALAAANPQDALQEVRQLNAQVMDLFDHGRYEEAKPLAQQALEISEKELGREHADTASALDGLALLNRAQGNFGPAESLHRQALSIREKVFGTEHLATADSFNRLGLLYQTMGDYQKAEPLFEHALKIRKQQLGADHPGTAEVLHNLGILHYATGAYAKAEGLLQQALEIQNQTLGPEHPTTGRSLNNLALLYSRMGAYVKAEPLYQQALRIRQQSLGPEHPDTAGSLNNLALLYYDTGAYAKAEPLYQQALKIFEKALGPNHPRTAGALGNLGLLYYQTGAYARAEPLFQRTLEITEKVLGPDHPRTSDSLAQLALVYVETGAYGQAEPLFQRALRIYENSVGPDNPHTAEALLNLGGLYTLTGDYAKAESLNQRALRISEKALGPEHPATANTLNNLADVYAASEAYAKAEPLYRRALTIQARNAERFLLTGSESRKQAYLQELARSTHRSVSFSVAARSPGSVALGLTAVLQYKGRVLDEMSDSVSRLRQSLNPVDRKIFEQFAEVANQFSALTYQGLGKLAPDEYRQQWDGLNQRQEALEADLAKRSVSFRQQVVPVTLDAVSRALPADAALVEWFRYQPFDPKSTPAKAQQRAARYVAYVLKANGIPTLLELGDARVIEASVREFLAAVQDPTRRDIKERARGLSDRLMAPLRAQLSGVQRVLLSPDGILNLVPMAALLDEHGQYLLGRLEMTYLTSGRDVLRMASLPGPQRGPIVVADPDYGKPARLRAAPEQPLQAQRSADLDRSGIVFKPLANTALEAQSIKSLLKLDATSVMCTWMPPSPISNSCTARASCTWPVMASF